MSSTQVRLPSGGQDDRYDHDERTSFTADEVERNHAIEKMRRDLDAIARGLDKPVPDLNTYDGRPIEEPPPLEQDGEVTVEGILAEDPARLEVEKAVDDLDRLLAEYIHFPDERQRWACVLWVAVTYGIDVQADGQYIFDVAPYLWVKSAGRNSGKTTLSYAMTWAAKHGKHSSSMTASAFYRQEERITPFFDEADNMFRAGRSSDDSETARLLQVINGGTTREGSVDRTSKTLKAEDFATFGPKAIIGISVPIPDTTSSRCIHIELVRAKHGEVKRRFRRRAVKPRAGAVGAVLAVEVPRLSVDLPPDDGYPELGFLVNRDHDIWEVMYGIAKAIGGAWPMRCIEAAGYLTEAEQSMSLGERLLNDVLEIFRQQDEDFLPTATLLGSTGGAVHAVSSYREESFVEEGSGLLGLDESPWATYRRTKPMNAHDLAVQLKPYGIEPDYEEPGRRRGQRGYFRAEVEAAAERWLHADDDEGHGAGPSTATTASVAEGLVPRLGTATTASTATSADGADRLASDGIDWDEAERANDDTPYRNPADGLDEYVGVDR